VALPGSSKGRLSAAGDPAFDGPGLGAQQRCRADASGQVVGSAVAIQDVTSLREAEQALVRSEEKYREQNKILNGVNRIFREALTCDTEEELGRTCLAVAEEVTGSTIGFIGEIGRDGLFHDIAISDPGWELCAMYDKVGHRRPPGNFAIHSLYGRVLQDGKSLLTNTPAEHPDSTGTPAGHPPLTAFLGAPLILAGRTIGMIAVGNREGGYCQAELEALEALAPAIVEAFARKRAEDTLREANETLQGKGGADVQAMSYGYNLMRLGAGLRKAARK
jgi:hypothetical protein